MVNVLLIGSDRLAPARIVADEPGVELSVICKPKYAHLYGGLARDVQVVDDVADLAQARAAALSMLRVHPVHAVVTPIERSVLTGGFVRSLLGLPGPGFDVALVCTDKYLMKRRLAGAGIPVAAHARLDDPQALPRTAAEVGGWPVVLKPAMGSGAMHQRVIQDEAAWRGFLDGGGLEPLLALGVPLVVERFLEVTAEYHCDSVVYRGRVEFASVGRYLKPPLRQTGYGGTVLIAPDEPAAAAVLALNQRALAALGALDAVTHLEVLSTPDGLRVGEVAIRPGGGGVQEAIALKHGRDLQRAFVQVSIGRAPDLPGPAAGATVAALGLPCANGRVRSVTPAAELERLPGVASVRIDRRPGDVIAEKVTSVFYSGLVLLCGPDPAFVLGAVAGVLAAFRIDIDAA